LAKDGGEDWESGDGSKNKTKKRGKSMRYKGRSKDECRSGKGGVKIGSIRPKKEEGEGWDGQWKILREGSTIDPIMLTE